MPVSANHHYVPQAILQNFCFEGESLFYYSKRRPELGVNLRNTASIFKKRHLNTYERLDGQKDSSLEDFFADHFDGQIGDLLETAQRHLSRNSMFSPSGDDFRFFVQFIYNHMFRTPEFHQPIVEESTTEKFFEGAIAEFEREHRKLSSEEAQNIRSEKSKKRIRDAGRVGGISRQSTKILNLMAEMKPVVASPANPKKRFVVTSNPVVRLTNCGGIRLDTDDIEFWTTLSPTVAIGLVRLPSARAPFRVLDHGVRHINLSLVNQSIAVAGQNERLIKSLINNR